MRHLWKSQIILLSLTLVSAYTPLTNEQSAFLISSLPRPISSYLSPEGSSLLSPILTPRPSGSEGASRVLNHFTQFFNLNVSNWLISLDEFIDSTPRGDIKFTNFVATRDPPGMRTGDVGRLVVAAHYDSKWFRKGSSMENFIGATDSAVPCAMLMFAALALDKFLLESESKTSSSDELEDPVGLQVRSWSALLKVDYIL